MFWYHTLFHWTILKVRKPCLKVQARKKVTIYHCKDYKRKLCHWNLYKNLFFFFFLYGYYTEFEVASVLCLLLSAHSQFSSTLSHLLGCWMLFHWTRPSTNMHIPKSPKESKFRLSMVQVLMSQNCSRDY